MLVKIGFLFFDRYLIRSEWMGDVSVDENGYEGEENTVKLQNENSDSKKDSLSTIISRVDRINTKGNRQLSNRASDLKISVPSFCKAFPWHFLTDRNLQIVQLGTGFMKLFGRQLKLSGKF